MNKKRRRPAEALPKACEACEVCETCETCEVASATECTGLMPALPEDMAEDESRAALYAIHSAKGSREDK